MSCGSHITHRLLQNQSQPVEHTKLMRKRRRHVVWERGPKEGLSGNHINTNYTVDIKVAISILDELFETAERT